MASFNGTLLPPKFDDLFKMMSDPDFADETFGNTESPTGAVAIIKYNGITHQLVKQLKDMSYPFVDEDWPLIRELEKGTYVTVIDDNGLIWVFFYEPDHDFLEVDLGCARHEYAQWDDTDQFV